MKQRVYIDTSVVGGYFDDEFAEGTIRFFELVNNGKIKIVVSDLLDAELFESTGFRETALKRY